MRRTDSNLKEAQPSFRRPTLWRVAGWFAFLTVLFFVGQYIFEHRHALTEIPPPHFGLIVLASLLAIGNYLLITLAYRILLRTHGVHVRFGETLALFWLPGLGRYVPGKIWVFAAALRLYHTLGLSKTRASAAFAMHTMLLLVSALIATAVSVGFFADRITVFWLLALAALLGVFSTPPVFYGLVNLALRLIGRSPLEYVAGWRELMQTTATVLLSRLAMGAAVAVLIGSLHALSFNDIAFLVATYFVAQIAGLFALFAPAGLGVREGFLLMALDPLIGPGAAIVATGMLRLWQTTLELLMAAIGWQVLRKKARSPRPKGGASTG